MTQINLLNLYIRIIFILNKVTLKERNLHHSFPSMLGYKYDR